MTSSRQGEEPAAAVALSDRIRAAAAASRETYPTALDLVLATLRGAILSGVIMPGERLRQEELADVFETSRIPVREALRALEYEGLVASEPHRGFTVTEVDSDQVTEIYELRILLEGQAIRLAIPLLTDEDLAELEGRFREMSDAVGPDGALAARERFYLRLYAVSGRPRLVGLIARLRQEVARGLRWPMLQHGPSIHEHIWDAVRDGDAERAVAQLTAHYQRVSALIRRNLREARQAGERPWDRPARER